MSIYYDIESNCYRTYPDGDKANDNQIKEMVEGEKLSIIKLQQENLKYKEVINKLKRYIEGCLELSPIEDRNVTDDVLDKELKYLLKIMKEVS